MATPTVAVSSYLLAAGVKRLLHDLKEVVNNPLPNVSCMPLEDDLYTWHGNVRSSPSSTLKGAPIHFLLHFPPNYPQSSPELRLFQPIPHPNVKPVLGSIQVLHVNSSNTHQRAIGVGRVAGQSRPIPRQARWRLAMYDCIPGKSAWSSAYSVLSVMLQLQVFLMDDDLHYDHQQVTPAAAVTKALGFDCPHCSHTGSSIRPAFASEAELAAASHNKTKKAVQKPLCPSRSRTTALYLKQHQRPKGVTPCGPSGASGSGGGNQQRGSVGVGISTSSCSTVSPCTTPTTASSSSSSGLGSHYTHPTASSISSSSSQSDGGGWFTVKGKGSKAVKAQGSAAAAAAAAGGGGDGDHHGGFSKPTASASSSTNSSSSRFAVLKCIAKDASVDVKQHQDQNKSAQLQLQQPQGPLSKAAKKNLARSLKRQQQQQQQHMSGSAAASSNSSSTAVGSTSPTVMAIVQAVTHVSPGPLQQQQHEATDWVEVGSKKKEAVHAKQQQYSSPLQQQLQQLEQQPMHQLIQQCLQSHSPEMPAPNSPTDYSSLNTSSSSSSSSSGHGGASEWSVTAGAAAAAGPLGQLPRDAMLGVLCLLRPADVAALTCTCRSLRAACEDGALWQTLMAQSFPGHSLKASNMQGWKVAYQLESAAILDELRCFYTRATHEEDVLGLPLTFSVNPVTKRVDYILAHPDLLSVTAFKAGVRHTPQQEEFGALLPLYLTAAHFNQALPHMEPLLKLLAPELVPRVGGCPLAAAWLDVLPKVLNTQVVLLADNGIAASQRSLAVSCQVYRLLLAVCEHWCLWPEVSARLDTFISSPQKRTKAAAPNLGLLLPLLSCSPVRHSWAVMSHTLLEEAFDRKVLWMCKKDPSLVEAFQSPRGSGANLQLVRGAWAGAAVSCKLVAFHLTFLQLVAAPKGSSLEGVMDAADAFYGWPAAALGSRFSKAVKRIQQVSGWQEWFAVLGRVPPTAAAMTDLLRSAWQRSLAKGYHKKDTDFSKVQASGVSRILLKGQSYSTPPGTKTVELEVHYKWRPEHFVRYLDGAVLLFGPGRKFLEMVAWNNQSSSTTSCPGAVTHSGDIMEFDQQSGKNLATICLSGLGPNITEAFITLSAWSDAMLSDIIQPYVQLFEPSTGVELCQVHVDGKELAVKRTHKCIIMARLFKESCGGWGVQSVGGFCQGNTGSFGQLDSQNDREGVGGMVAGIKALAR